MIKLEYIIVIFGLVFGSFANVCILRNLSGESLGGRSHCINCMTELTWLDTIPVLSYLYLHGHCRYCGKSISFQYLVIETLYALVVLSIYLHTGLTISFLLYSVVAFTLIILVGTDFLEKIIDDRIVLGSLLIIVPIQIYLGKIHFLIQGALFAFVCSSFVYLLGITLQNWRKAIYIYLIIWQKKHLPRYLKGAGDGDIMISIFLGIIFGWKAFCLIFLFAHFLVILIYVVSFIKWNSEIPFVPFLAMSVAIHAILPGGLIGQAIYLLKFIRLSY